MSVIKLRNEDDIRELVEIIFDDAFGLALGSSADDFRTEKYYTVRQQMILLRMQENGFSEPSGYG